MSYPRTGIDLLFTGRELDRSTGLYYYRARYYDPEIGRFLSEDPLGFEAGVNFYAYVGNNPVNANDPSGLCPAGGLICAGLVIGAGGVIGIGVPAIISNVIDFVTGASPEQTAAHNAAFVDAAQIVGGIALAPIVLGTGIVAAEIATNFVLANPIVSTEIAGGIVGTLMAPDAFEPTLSVPGATAGFLTGLALDAADSLSSSSSTPSGCGFCPSGSELGPGPWAPAASGGFVLYPSKANTNQLQSAYAK